MNYYVYYRSKPEQHSCIDSPPPIYDRTMGSESAAKQRVTEIQTWPSVDSAWFQTKPFPGAFY